MAELLEDSEWLNRLCPACKRPLASGKTAVGYVVWCPRLDCTEMSDGPNEGGYGKTVDKAYGILMAKLGLNKNYQAEVADEPTTSEEPTTKAEKGDKPKKGKRGRKPKATGPFTVPVGKFTMTEFCTANETYPYKALPFFKEKGIVEVGKRPTASGRGKPSILYAVKN